MGVQHTEPLDTAAGLAAADARFAAAVALVLNLEASAYMKAVTIEAPCGRQSRKMA